jgi:hypothetical protein
MFALQESYPKSLADFQVGAVDLKPKRLGFADRSGRRGTGASSGVPAHINPRAEYDGVKPLCQFEVIARNLDVVK